MKEITHIALRPMSTNQHHNAPSGVPMGDPGPVEAIGAPEGVFLPMPDDMKSPSFEFPQISKHEVYESKSGNIVIAQICSDCPNRYVTMPTWRARQIIEAMEKLINCIEDRKNHPSDSES